MSKFVVTVSLLPHLVAFAYLDTATVFQQLVADLLVRSLVKAIIIVRQMDRADRRHED